MLRTASRVSLSELQHLVGGTWSLDWVAAGQLVGFTGRIVAAGYDEETKLLYVDTDEGYRYDLPEWSINISAPEPAEETWEPVSQVEDFYPETRVTVADVERAHDAEVAHAADAPLCEFICGTAGTGKTFQQKALAAADTSRKLCATTGIAAVNLGEGVTINSLLHFPDTSGLRIEYELGRLHAMLIRMTESGYTRIVLDEVSMLDGNALDIIQLAIDEVNEKRLGRGAEPIGLTLVGDFAQLPPVKAPFAFEARCWEKFEANTTMLTEPRRQADPDFVRALQAVRRGDVSGAMTYFGARLTNRQIERFNGTTIFAKNDEVDRYNRLRLLDLHTDEVSFLNSRAGEQNSEWNKHIPPRLELKRGALVMILANKREAQEGIPSIEWPMLYANGDLGTLEDWTQHEVEIPDPLYKPPKPKEGEQVKDEDWPRIKVPQAVAMVRLHRTDRVVQVGHVHREKGEATGHKGVRAPREDITGWIDYLPLRVAYATTCHKSQGLSLDAVQIMFHSWFWQTPGMLYVALSRARTAEGLTLVGTPEQFKARIKTNPKVRRWL